MPNEYTRKWFDVFLDTMPTEWTDAEIRGLVRRLPLPSYRRLLDICCGPGRHASHLVAAGYDVTGVDRDPTALHQARRRAPGATFVECDLRDLDRIAATFDAALILWQSFGYFGPAENDRVLRSVSNRLRPGGRLLLDVYHPAYFHRRQGRTTDVRDPRCEAITNSLDGLRMTSTIEYSDGTTESMEWELFQPDDLVDRAARAGMAELERCSWWEEGRAPTDDDQRYQLVLQKL